MAYPYAGGAGTSKSDIASCGIVAGGSMSQSLTERYDDRIAGMPSCYDRLVITGLLPVICYAAGMTGYLNAKGIRIFDYPEFAKTLRDRVTRAATLAAEAGITIEHLAKPHIRKEDVVARVLRQRGDQFPVWCTSSRRWKPATRIQTLARQADPQDLYPAGQRKCLQNYFYFQDATSGLVYLARADLGAVPPAVLLQRP